MRPGNVHIGRLAQQSRRLAGRGIAVDESAFGVRRAGVDAELAQGRRVAPRRVQVLAVDEDRARVQVVDHGRQGFPVGHGVHPAAAEQTGGVPVRSCLGGGCNGAADVGQVCAVLDADFGERRPEEQQVHVSGCGSVLWCPPAAAVHRLTRR